MKKLSPKRHTHTNGGERGPRTLTHVPTVNGQSFGAKPASGGTDPQKKREKKRFQDEFHPRDENRLNEVTSLARMINLNLHNN